MQTTLKTLLEDFVKEYAGSVGGRVGACTSQGLTSTVIDATRFLAPVSVSEWTRGSPVRMTGATAGTAAAQAAKALQSGFLDTYDPSTGTLTVLGTPFTTPTANDTFIIIQKHITDSFDHLIEAANRGLRRWCARRQKVPITEIVGGDLLGTIADWTLSGTSPAYTDEAVPDGLYSRYVHMPRTGATDTARPTTDMAVMPGDIVDIYTYARLFGGATSWGFRVQDATNGNADIPVSYNQGAATQTLTESWTEAAGVITVPTGCYKIRPVYNLTSTTGGMDFGPLVMTRRFAYNFTAQAMADAVTRRVGDFYYGYQTRAGEAPAGLTYRKIAVRCDVDNEGFGIVFRFQPDYLRPFPLFYEQLLTYGPLTLMADVTPCPEDLALAAMALEFFEFADMTERRTNQNIYIRQRRVSASRWEADKQEAKETLRLARKAWGCEPKLFHRREYDGRASA